MFQLNSDPNRPRASQHRDLSPSEILHSEKATQSVMKAIHNFTNPSAIADKSRLYSLASGAPATAKVTEEVLCAEKIGREARNAFNKERMELNCGSSFFEPLKRKKMKTMEACNKTVKITSSQGKVSSVI